MKTNVRVKVILSGKMEKNTKVNGIMESNMELVTIKTQTIKNERVNGLKEKESVGYDEFEKLCVY
jgi:hypothetical protein